MKNGPGLAARPIIHIVIQNSFLPFPSRNGNVAQAVRRSGRSSVNSQFDADLDHVRFRRRVKVIRLVSLCLALSALLWSYKVGADVFTATTYYQVLDQSGLRMQHLARMLLG